MSKNSGFFAFMTIYWKTSRKWFLGLIAGMAALELGLLLYYINGGYRQLFINDNQGKLWPIKYHGALKSIRLEYFMPVFAVVLILLLVLMFYSINTKSGSAKLTQRLPINHKRQILYRIAHSFILIVYVWLVQFLILIAGFLVYRSNAPAGLNLNFQMYNVFAAPGLISEVYPLMNPSARWIFLLGLLLLSLLPAYITDAFEQGKVFRNELSVSIVCIAAYLLHRTSLLSGKALTLSVMVVLILIMIRSLFIPDLFPKKAYGPEVLRLKTIAGKGEKDP